MGEFERMLLSQLTGIADKVDLLVDEMAALKTRMKSLEQALEAVEGHGRTGSGFDGPNGLH